MSHPSIASSEVREHLDELLEGTLDDLSHLSTMVGVGVPADLTQLAAAVQEIKDALDGRRTDGDGDLDDDQFEGAMSGRLHQTLAQLDVDVLDDPGFWAYVAAGPLWPFVRWREDAANRKRETYHVYVDGTKPDMCVPLRMFLRAQAIEVDGDYSLASSIRAGTDFWRSHLIRVKSGGKKDLARVIVTEQRDHRMTVEPLRQYAKRINRRWSNQVIEVLDTADCVQIAEAERP